MFGLVFIHICKCHQTLLMTLLKGRQIQYTEIAADLGKPAIAKLSLRSYI